MQLFYTPDISDESYTLTVEESRHAVQVLRVRSGDIIHLIDGIGGLYEAEIVEPSPKGCVIRVLTKVVEYGKRNYGLHIAMAPTKNIDRFEWFLEKATEIGVDIVTPILCDRSERKVIKKERCEKIVLSASKQSLKAYVPQIDELERFDSFIGRDFGAAGKYIAHCDESFERQELTEAITQHGFSVVMIGAEGDFSPAEIERAYGLGFRGISLGKNRLRTETAGVFAAAIAALQK